VNFSWVLFSFFGTAAPHWARAFSFTRFLDHTQRCTTVGRTALDEWSARRRHLPDNTQHSQQTDIHAPGGIRTHNPSCWAATDLRLRLRCPWDRLFVNISIYFLLVNICCLERPPHFNIVFMGKSDVDIRRVDQRRRSLNDLWRKFWRRLYLCSEYVRYPQPLNSVGIN
jgi:hypothetical protein